VVENCLNLNLINIHQLYENFQKKTFFFRKSGKIQKKMKFFVKNSCKIGDCVVK